MWAGSCICVSRSGAQGRGFVGGGDGLLTIASAVTPGYARNVGVRGLSRAHAVRVERGLAELGHPRPTLRRLRRDRTSTRLTTFALVTPRRSPMPYLVDFCAI